MAIDHPTHRAVLTIAGSRVKDKRKARSTMHLKIVPVVKYLDVLLLVQVKQITEESPKLQPECRKQIKFLWRRG